MNNLTIGLVDATYIKENSLVFSNIEDKFINPSILRVQNFYVKNILGSTLYNTVINAYAANMNAGTAIPSRISDLVDVYILPIIMHYVVSDMANATLKLTAQGILKPKTIDAGDAPDASEVKTFKENYITAAETYAAQLIDFLLLNSNDYPEYLTSDPDDSTIGSTRAHWGFSIGGDSLIGPCSPEARNRPNLTQYP